MGTDRKLDHPSNILFSGNVRDFELAMDLVIGECNREMAEGATFSDDPDYQATIENLNSGLIAFREAAEACKTEWLEHVREAELALAEKWLASDSNPIRSIGR